MSRQIVIEHRNLDEYSYEVLEVIDQKHMKIRMLNKNYESDERYDILSLVRRGDSWYNEIVATAEDLMDIAKTYWIWQNSFDPNKIMEKGFQKRYVKMEVMFINA